MIFNFCHNHLYWTPTTISADVNNAGLLHNIQYSNYRKIADMCGMQKKRLNNEELWEREDVRAH